ncbi:NPHP4 protein, partial [Eudromia elegans]|nr:NPHP4 protein [Eudromia elegans]
MSAWERLFLQNVPVPPHRQRSPRAPEASSALQCVLKRIQGAAFKQRAAEGSSETEYQLRLTLFDVAYRHFFGRTWRSRRRPLRVEPRQPPGVVFNETIYFHTSLDHPSITAVVEVVAIVKKQDGISQDLSCGFGIIHLFNSKLETTNLAAKDRGLKLYHGTPRALLHPLFQDPVEKNKYMTVMENSQLQYTLRPHAPLETILHLFPENLLMSGLQKIPGVLPARGHTDDCFLAPRLMKPITCYLDKVSVHLYPSLEEFEEELLDLLNSDRLLKASAAPDGCAVAVQERRLRVGVHNGLAFVQAPQVAVLVPEAAVARGRSAGLPGKQDRGSRASTLGQALLLRSRIHLPEMVHHPAFAIVFQLEYVFCVPGGADGKASGVTMHVLRWAAWSPTEGAAEVAVPLRGGAHRSPGQALVYRERGGGSSSAEVRQFESGTVQFHISMDSEEHLVTSTDVSSKEREESERPPTPALSESVGVPPAARRARGHGERGGSRGGSRGGRAVPLRTRRSPPGQELPRGSSPAGIAHLEAELSVGTAGAEDSEPLRELPFVPVHVPVTAAGPARSAAQSQASLAILRTSGFPEILDCNREPVEVGDPSDPGSFSYQLEDADVLQSNEIILQFMAFTRVLENGFEASWPQTVFFTFQFYRFPAVTTARLQLRDAGGAHVASPCVLVPIREDSGLGAAGLQLRYVVDAAALEPGERRCFVRYLAERSLHLDVWDGDSLLLVGSAVVRLQPLLRQGRAAVRSHHELDVTATEYEEDAVVPGPDAGVLRPGGIRVATKGRLHLCLANVGKSCGRGAPLGGTAPLGRPGLIPVLAGCPVPTAPAPGHLLRSSLSRLTCYVLAAQAERAPSCRVAPVSASAPSAPCSPRAWSTTAARSARHLQLVDAYRERLKGEGIASTLRQAITSSHTVRAAPGTAAFFEFALRNPYNVQHTVTVEIEHPELSVIVDTREWRHFKELTKTATPVEENMFQLHHGHGPQLYLRPRETVHVPFKYQTFSVEPVAAQQQGPVGLSGGDDEAASSLQKPGKALAKHIEVSFHVSGQKPIAILQVKVETQAHVVDQTFRFYHPELTFLKKAIRLPPWHTLPGAPAGMPGGEPEMYVRCSDPNVICETKHMGPGEPQDVFLKVAGGPSPQIKKFFVAIYTDAWLAAPIHIWQFFVHSVRRVDVSCVAGQRSRLCLLLRGTPAPRKVKAYTSHPRELKVEPDGEFILPAHGVQELAVGVRPRQAGSGFLHLNVVDVECHQLVSSWLLCVSCRQPLLSKAFEIALPAGGGRGCNKRITYTNPYPSRRRYFLHTSRPDLLRFREDSFEVAAGEVHTIGLRFAPGRCVGREEVLIHINDHEDKNEETFCVTVTYE